ncbi:hypothetical protein BDQ17DRAFT_1205129, partial [Cyathus striatus]
KPPSHLLDPRLRRQADEDMRLRFKEVTHYVKIPKIVGICAMGRKVAYYRYDLATGVVESPNGACSKNPYNVPMEWWDSDVMEKEGQNKLLRVVQGVLEAV